MRILIEAEIKDWMPPNYVNTVDEKLPSIPIKDVDVKTLDQLCKNFRAAVFQKAGKPDPEVR